MKRSGDLVIARDRLIGGASHSVNEVKISDAAYICHPERVGANAPASRRTSTKTVPEHTASGSSHKAANLTAETQRRGENQKPTTEEPKRGERRRRSDFFDQSITCDHQITRSLHLCHPERVGANATASRRIPAALIPEHAASGSSHKTPEGFLQGFRNAIRTLRATLREIFDESAYDRFLLRTQASRSTASYREFTRERDAAMAKKPRCC